jgi:cation diffusion facilitator CzcD-associated flavoprotein CzcO
VIGAGITGIHQLYRLREAGFSTVVLEAGSGVGGTWYWNRYPGARFDSESYTYGYFFSPELYDEWGWKEHFASQVETEEYLNHVVDRFDMRSDIVTDTRVAGATYEEPANFWTVTATDGRVFRGRIVIAATGVLSQPFIPAYEGIDSFAGVAHHTGRWPGEPVDFAGKRVAVIGTGASSVQILPVIAPEVESLTVYQRTANWCPPLHNSPITDEEQAIIKRDREDLYRRCGQTYSGFIHADSTRMTSEYTAAERHAVYEELWQTAGFKKMFAGYADVATNPDANKEYCDFIAGKIRETVKDPELAEKLIPRDHGFGMKRPPLESGYYEAFNRDNVHLIDLRETPIVRVTETGIEHRAGTDDATGTEHREYDVIVWATGFDAMTGALNRMRIQGVGGRLLKDHWAEGPRTYLGLQSTGFPNFFMVGGAQSVYGNVPRATESHVEFVSELLRVARDRGADVIQTNEVDETAWVAHVDEAAAPILTADSAWYQGSNIPGKPVKPLLYLPGVAAYAGKVREIAAQGFPGFELSKSGTQVSPDPDRAAVAETAAV